MNLTNESYATIGSNVPALEPSDNSLKLIYDVTHVLISGLTLLINGMVLLLVYKRPKLLKSISNQIVLSLSISDASTGLLMMSHFIPNKIPAFQNRNSPISYWYRITIDIATLSVHLISMGNLCLVITERYIALIYPYTMEKYLSKRKVKIAIILIWVCAFVYSSIQFAWLHEILDGVLTEEENNMVLRAEMIFSLVSIILFVFLPILILLLMFIQMFKEIRNFTILDTNKRRKEEKRAITIFATMYILFVLFSLPYFLVRLIIDLNIVAYAKLVKWCQAVYLLKSLPSLLNPFIYVFNKPDFKREICKEKEKISKYVSSKVSTISIVSRRASADGIIELRYVIDRNNNNNGKNKFRSQTQKLMGNEKLNCSV